MARFVLSNLGRASERGRGGDLFSFGNIQRGKASQAITGRQGLTARLSPPTHARARGGRTERAAARLPWAGVRATRPRPVDLPSNLALASSTSLPHEPCQQSLPRKGARRMRGRTYVLIPSAVDGDACTSIRRYRCPWRP